MLLKNVTKALQHKTIRCYAAMAMPKSRPKQKARPGQEKSLISCRRPELDLLKPEAPDAKFGSIPLASKGWLHHKSKGDFFTINAVVTPEQRNTEMEDIEKFLTNTNITIDPELIKVLKTDFQINQFTGIQTAGIPKIYQGCHALIAAETGCGKTVSYLLPIIQQILDRKRAPNSTVANRRLNSPLAIIITPGRELASQIATVAEQLCEATDLNVAKVLGGNTKRLLLDPDFQDIDILVATVGALSKLVTTGIYRINHVQHIVLDEADTMLDDSFSDKLCYLLAKFPFHQNQLQSEGNPSTQLVLASATMPTNINERLQKIIDVQTLCEIVSPNLHRLMPHVKQKFLRTNKADRPGNLVNIVKTELSRKRPIIVFSNKSVTSDYVSLFLNNCGVNCINLNGDMLMKIRLGRFEQFQNGHCDVLSTTDVGSRGLDTTRARHVINFDFPLHVSDYIHRCGRIGRVNSMDKCLVTNLISSRREIDVVQRIEHAARTGGLLPNVNANIKNLINKRIIEDMKAAGIKDPTEVQEEMF